jgi:hypothetical protein
MNEARLKNVEAADMPVESLLAAWLPPDDGKECYAVFLTRFKSCLVLEPQTI